MYVRIMYRSSFQKNIYPDDEMIKIVSEKINFEVENGVIMESINETLIDQYMNIVNATANDVLHYRRGCRKHTFHQFISSSDLPSPDGIYLFIVNFHYTYYNNTEWMDKVFFKEFCSIFKSDFDVLMIGITGDKEKRVINNLLPKRGWYSYHSVRVIMELLQFSKHIIYDGYFLMNDDSFVDPYLLNSVDLSIGFKETVHHSYKPWKWWRMINSNAKNFSVASKEAVSEMNSRKDIRAICGEQKWHKDLTVWGDFFYIPKKDITSYIRVEEIIFRHKVFLENAVELLLNCISKGTVNSCNHRHCYYENEILVHIHPVKYSSQNSRDHAMALMRSHNITKSTI